jgi:hypothetical protein
MKNDPIAQSLDLVPLEINSSVSVIERNRKTDEDFEFARSNIIAAIDKGQEALSGILDVATMSQHPRSYEVVATLVKAVADANKDLLELQKRHRDLTGEVPNPSTINNNLFVGSTAELQKLLKKHNGENQ